VTDAFLHRFLAQRGPGIHHVTFTVPSLSEACDRARAHGYLIVGYDDSDPEWKEAFLRPKEALGIVVQFAEPGPRPSGENAPRWPPPPGPANPPPTAAAGAFMVQSGETKGRTAEIRSEYDAAIGCTHSQRLWCYRDQRLLESNVSSKAAQMTKVVKGLCFGVLGGVLACGLTLLLAFGYSYDSLTGDFIIRALVVGAVLGFVAGAVWGSAVTKWLFEALMNL